MAEKMRTAFVREMEGATFGRKIFNFISIATSSDHFELGDIKGDG